jgi:hypothetical protein
VPVNTAADFLARYDEILSQFLRGEIAGASVLPQSGRTQVDVTPAGLTIGSNLVIVERVAGRLQIVSIAVVAPPESAGAANSPREPRRVTIRVGPKPTQVAGSLAVDIIDSYLVFVPKGQTLAVQLQRVPAGAAVIRVAREGTGAPLNPKTIEGRSVSGMVTDGGNYRIEVRRLSDQDAALLPYVLSLTLR